MLRTSQLRTKPTVSGIVAAWLAALLVPVIGQAADEPVDFRRDVAPILQQRCLACHNQRVQRGGLSLHSADAVRRGGESGQAIEAGDPESSYLLDLVIPTDGEAEMPQGEPPLKPDEIEMLRRWIADGAQWPEGVVLEPPTLWSLKPVVRPGVPVVEPASDSLPIRNPIDSFIAAKLREAGLKPAPEADRRTLIRRLYLISLAASVAGSG